MILEHSTPELFDNVVLHSIVDTSTDIDLLKYLVFQMHCDVNKKNDSNETLLAFAMRKEAYEVVKFLVTIEDVKLGKLQIANHYGFSRMKPLPDDVLQFIDENNPEIANEYRNQMDEFMKTRRR